MYCVPSTHVHSPNLPETRVPTSHPLFPIPSTRHDSSSISPRPTPLVDQTLTLSCMWGDCQARFSSLSDLVGHVNLEHLRLPSNTTSSPPNRIPDVDPSHLSCLWRDCNIYPSSESIPTSSSGDTADGMRSILANHLLHDHLGSYHFHGSLDSPRQELESVQTQPALVLDTSECSPTPPPPWDSLSGTHQCCWQSCGQKFCTFEDLTSHITNIHVGGGKAQYECLWQGCNRNGENGFSSKQKICRHLQVIGFTTAVLDNQLMSSPSTSLIQAIDPINVISASSISQKLQPCNSICAGTPKKVSLCVIYLFAALIIGTHKNHTLATFPDAENHLLSLVRLPFTSVPITGTNRSNVNTATSMCQRYCFPKVQISHKLSELSPSRRIYPNMYVPLNLTGGRAEVASTASNPHRRASLCMYRTWMQQVFRAA